MTGRDETAGGIDAMCTAVAQIAEAATRGARVDGADAEGALACFDRARRALDAELDAIRARLAVRESAPRIEVGLPPLRRRHHQRRAP